MTAPTQAPVTVTPDPERIYLQPRQCVDVFSSEGRLWCEDPVWPSECGCDCPTPAPATCYVREDIARTAAEAASAARVAELVGALEWIREKVETGAWCQSNISWFIGETIERGNPYARAKASSDAGEEM